MPSLAGLSKGNDLDVISSSNIGTRQRSKGKKRKKETAIGGWPNSTHPNPCGGKKKQKGVVGCAAAAAVGLSDLLM